MMRTANHRPRVIAASLAAASLMLAPVAGASGPPAGKYYGVVLVIREPASGLVDTPYECLKFTKKKMCVDAGGQCGTWELTGSTGSRNAWTGEIVIELDGLEILVEFAGLTEKSGVGSSIAATFDMPAMGVNGGLAGTQMSRRECRAFALSDEGRSRP